MKDQKLILRDYLHCALWCEELDSREISEVDEKSVEQAEKDIASFVDKAGDLLADLSEEQIGHDFWLSRNGHGAGFFDRGLGEIGDKLQKIAREEFVGKDVFAEEDIIIIE